MQQIKSIWFSAFLRRFKPLPGQTVLCKPRSNIPFICIPTPPPLFPWKSPIRLSGLGFMWLRPSSFLWFWAKIVVWSSLIVVVPGCTEGVHGEVYNCVLDWFKGKAILPFSTSSLPFLSSWQRVWVFEKRGKMRKILSLFSYLSLVLHVNWYLHNFSYVSPSRNEFWLTCWDQILR